MMFVKYVLWMWLLYGIEIEFSLFAVKLKKVAFSLYSNLIIFIFLAEYINFFSYCCFILKVPRLNVAFYQLNF